MIDIDREMVIIVGIIIVLIFCFVMIGYYEKRSCEKLGGNLECHAEYLPSVNGGGMTYIPISNCECIK